MRTLCAAICVFAFMLAATSCSRKQDDAAVDRTLVVRAAQAAVHSFERRLTVQGTLEAKNFANVASRADGNLDAIWVDEGDAVVAGKTALFQIDPASRENAVTIARQNLAVAEASLAVANASAERVRAETSKAELDFARYERLHNEGNASDNEYESAALNNTRARAGLAVALAQVDLAERQVKQAEATLAIAQKSLDDTKVFAPISGVVSSRKAEPGEQMSVGEVVLRIDDLSYVEAAALLPAQYYSEVQPGKTAFHLTVNGSDAGTHTITYRSPTINPTLRTFEIKGRVEAAAGLAVPGNMAGLTIVFETRQGTGVPSAAILSRAEKQIVFVVQNGKAAAREVRTGLQNDAWTEILSGLEAGETVIVEGQTLLRDGDPVEVK